MDHRLTASLADRSTGRIVQVSNRRESERRVEASVAGPPMLEIDDLTVTYEDGGVVALDRVDLRVHEGEFVCFVGVSGCGKTTLLEAIAGLVPAASGTVRVRGRAPDPRRGETAMVFQDDALLPWRTVLENVRFGLDMRARRTKATDDRARDVVELTRLGGFEDCYPHELSGGMRQRVNLARALALDADVLLMDEPFGALDTQTREVMQTELLEIWKRQRKTVLFVTHQLAEAVRLGDRVVVLSASPGRVREEIAIDIPRPRDARTEHSPALASYVEDIWSCLQDDIRRTVSPTLHGGIVLALPEHPPVDG
jgi:NitT/TauT family transport system ATP-binding protein